MGPLGKPLTMNSLPPTTTTRWLPRRKAEIVAAVNGGLLSFDEACDRYGLTTDELPGWQRAIERSRISDRVVQWFETPVQYFIWASRHVA